MTKEQQTIVHEALGRAFSEVVKDPRMSGVSPEMFGHAWLSMANYNLNVVGIRTRRMLVSIAAACDSPEIIGRGVIHQATGGAATFEAPKAG